jgi:hypothetical protein
VQDEINLMDMYKMSCEEEKYFLSEHHKRFAFYISLIVLCFGAVLTAIFQAKLNPGNFYFLIFGPFVIILVSFIGMLATKSSYKRFLEAITFRAKIEVDLKMDKIRDNNDGEAWYCKEPYINKRYLIDRNDGSRDSKEWVDNKLKFINLNKWFGILQFSNVTFCCTIFLSIMIIFCLFYFKTCLIN